MFKIFDYVDLRGKGTLQTLRHLATLDFHAERLLASAIDRGSYMNAHVLLNLLKSWGKDINVRLAEHFISFSQRV